MGTSLKQSVHRTHGGREPAFEERHALREEARSKPSLAVREPHVVFALPAYNESATLRALLESIHCAMLSARLPYEVVVVDDGSADDTGLIASQASFSLPVTLVEHETNQGLAAALRTGIRRALALCQPGDVVVTMDADNTHRPALVDRMVQMIGEGHDIVIGSRFRPGSRVIGVPWSRRAMTLCARLLFQAVHPIKGVRDYTCGFRAYRAELLERAMIDYGDNFVSEKGFSCMVDVLLKLRRYRPVIGETPMILRYDQKGGESKMRVLRTAWQTLGLIFRRRLQRASRQ
jgi:dolichol-phosphate mannosyltransferase